MEKFKNFYQSFCRELWMLFVAIAMAVVFCLVLHNDPTASMWFGGTLIYGIALLLMLSIIRPILTYAALYSWIASCVVTAGVMIFFGLHIVKHVPAWETIVFVLSWTLVFSLFGILNMAVFTKEQERQEK